MSCPFNRTPMAYGLAQKTMATFGHCGIWTYDLPPDFNWGNGWNMDGKWMEHGWNMDGNWMEWSVKSQPFWKLVAGLVSSFHSHLDGMSLR